MAATMLFHQIICSISYLIHIILFMLKIILEPQWLLLRGKVKVKSLSSVWLCNPMNCSLPGSSVHGILQARILEWVAISFSRGSSQPRDRTQVSRIGSRHFNCWATREPYWRGVYGKFLGWYESFQVQLYQKLGTVFLNLVVVG